MEMGDDIHMKNGCVSINKRMQNIHGEITETQWLALYPQTVWKVGEYLKWHWRNLLHQEVKTNWFQNSINHKIWYQGKLLHIELIVLLLDLFSLFIRFSGLTSWNSLRFNQRMSNNLKSLFICMTAILELESRICLFFSFSRMLITIHTEIIGLILGLLKV
jgi:hypothetical protein